jgi:hypothetical protein
VSGSTVIPTTIEPPDVGSGSAVAEVVSVGSVVGSSVALAHPAKTNPADDASAIAFSGAFSRCLS